MAASTTVVDQAAERGFDNAAAYDEHRPSYPPEALASLLSHLGVADKSRARLVDLAAGTGKFTELLGGYDVMAVEPVAAMRAQLEAKRLPGVTVVEGLATGMGAVADGWADAVVAAQSFHWFAHEEALTEIRRVLKPGGKLGVIWNIEDYNQPMKWTAATRWEGELKQLIHDIPPDGPARFRDDKWWHVFDRQSRAADPLFATPIGEEKVSFSAWLTRDKLWDRVHTLSQVATLQGADKEAFRAGFDRILKDGADGKWNQRGEVEIHGTTVFAWTARL